MSKLASVAAGAAAALAITALPAGQAHAQSVASGTIVIVAADPQDFVIELDQAGVCGSRYFHVQRASANFKEMVALALTAYSASRPVVMFVVGCAGNRNIISHGYAAR